MWGRDQIERMEFGDAAQSVSPENVTLGSTAIDNAPPKPYSEEMPPVSIDAFP
jgi:hypothetical protein